MSIEFINDSTLISRKYSREFWRKALELARLYGWKPKGTRPPSLQLKADWNGTYLTNDGQVIFAEDACSLAHALEKSLDDIPDEGAKMDWNPMFWIEDDLPEWLSPDEKDLIEDGLQAASHAAMEMHPCEFFAGDEKVYLKEFIRFCRLGSFMIL